MMGNPQLVGVVEGDPRQMRGAAYYPVSFDPREESKWVPEASLEVFVKPKGVAALLAEREVAETERFLTSVMYKKLEKPLSDNLYTFYSSRTEFQVHQFKPVVKFLDSIEHRLFLADEVGLGKTIESGIILTELEARLGGLSRILIVCPSMLTQKWQQEMEKRFGLKFAIVRREQLEEFLEGYAQYGQHQGLKAIVSLQLLRGGRFLHRLMDLRVHFDLVIVDEAHHMRNPGTRSSDLGDVLSELSDAMLMLSATPLHLGSEDVFNVLRILSPAQFDSFNAFKLLIEPNEHINMAMRLLYEPQQALECLQRVEDTHQRSRFLNNPYYQDAVRLLAERSELGPGDAVRAQMLLCELNTLSHVFTRTKKRDVSAAFPVREARVLAVRFTPEEMEFYNAVTAYVESQFTKEFGSMQGISFARIMPQRQVASCMPAMKSYLEAMIQAKRLKAARDDDGDVIDPEADEADEELTAPEIDAMSRLLSSAARVAGMDTKFDVFLLALRSLEEEAPEAKIMVFSFFKKTLEYLNRRLAGTRYGGRVELIHGDIKPETRQKTIRRFRETEKVKILLSSEVAGEGLDFEFCSVIFNYDLPWNPMRVEQRIGRLDRYGQKHEKILIYNFSMEGTIDSEILHRLYARIGIFERYIGDLEAILGGQIAKLTREIFSPGLTPQQKTAMIQRAAENVGRRQEELEQFEKEAEGFVGQDEYFNVEISDIERKRRFITPGEVERFVRVFIGTHCPTTTLRPPKKGREGVYVLKTDPECKKFAWAYTQGYDQREETLAALEQPQGALVTFDSAEACADDSLMFLTIHHPLVKAMKCWYDDHPEEVRVTGALRLGGCPDARGDYFFFIYLLEKSALKQELNLVPIFIGIDGQESHWLSRTCEWFMANIMEAEGLDPEALVFSGDRLGEALRESEEYMALVRDEAEEELLRRNNALIDNRTESIRQAAEIKIQQVKGILAKLRADGRSEEDSIVRLHTGRIANLGERMEAEIQKLQDKRQVIVTFSLVLGGVVRLDP